MNNPMIIFYQTYTPWLLNHTKPLPELPGIIQVKC